jgi:hypothetical protein
VVRFDSSGMLRVEAEENQAARCLGGFSLASHGSGCTVTSFIKVLRQLPAHLFVQVVEALNTYPTVVLGDVAFPLDARGIGLHECCPASFAVIVVPIRPWRDVVLRAEDCAPSPLCIIDAPVRHGESKPTCQLSQTAITLIELVPLAKEKIPFRVTG